MSYGISYGISAPEFFDLFMSCHAARRFKVKSRSSASARLPAAMKPGALGKSNLD